MHFIHSCAIIKDEGLVLQQGYIKIGKNIKSPSPHKEIENLRILFFFEDFTCLLIIMTRIYSPVLPITFLIAEK